MLGRSITEQRERREAENEARNANRKAVNLRVLATTVLRPHVSGAAVLSARPKSEAKRNPALLEMARGRECLLRVPGVCKGDSETVAAAHSNFGQHQKGGARRADDCYSVWACGACHIGWLDQPIGADGPTYEQKRDAFMAAHLRQVNEWRRIAQDPSESDRTRKAALWALDALNATPTGEM